MLPDELAQGVVLGEEVGPGQPVLVVHGGQGLDVAAEQRFTFHRAGVVHAAGSAFGAVECAGPFAITSLDLENLGFKGANGLGELIIGPFARPQGHDIRKLDCAVFDERHILCMERWPAISATVAATLAAWLCVVCILQVCVAPQILFGYRLCRSITCCQGPILCMGFDGKSGCCKTLWTQGERWARNIRISNGFWVITG